MISRRFWFWPLLWVSLCGASVLHLTWGAPVAFADLWSRDASAHSIARQIFFEYRPPRAVAALLVGASLSIAGAGLQSLFRNPLAEPYLLGISSGGALGATLAAALQLPSYRGFDAGAIFAFGGALGAASAVYALGQSRSGNDFGAGFGQDSARLLLSGVALSAFLSALMSLVIALSGRFNLAQQISFWLLGGLTRASWPQNAVLLGAFLLGGAILLGCSRDLNALRAGEEDAAALGVETGWVHRKILFAASLLAAACVAAAGLIGFVGLLAPHAIRLLGGRDARVLLPGAALGGGALLCACDALARGVHPPLEIPVGILTALLGVPLFLFLARRSP